MTATPAPRIPAFPRRDVNTRRMSSAMTATPDLSLFLLPSTGWVVGERNQGGRFLGGCHRNDIRRVFTSVAGCAVSVVQALLYADEHPPCFTSRRWERRYPGAGVAVIADDIRPCILHPRRGTQVSWLQALLSLATTSAVVYYIPSRNAGIRVAGVAVIAADISAVYLIPCGTQVSVVQALLSSQDIRRVFTSPVAGTQVSVVRRCVIAGERCLQSPWLADPDTGKLIETLFPAALSNPRSRTSSVKGCQLLRK